jgi:polar amino acid transport system permease protein
MTSRASRSMIGIMVAASMLAGCNGANEYARSGIQAASTLVIWMQEVLRYAVEPFLLQGALLALEISALAMLLGLTLGLTLAVMRLSRSWALRGIAGFYIWFVRGTPLLLQLVFLYDALPRIGVKLDTFTTAVLGFALNEAAFSGEFIRGGILSVNRTQTMAAAAFGMAPFLTLRRIVLPQAMRAILPQVANSTIGMIKGTSIASVIFVNELTFRSEQIVAQNFAFFTVLTAAAIIYLVMTSIVAYVQAALERYFNVELERRGGPRFLNRLIGGGRRTAAAARIIDEAGGASQPVVARQRAEPSPSLDSFVALGIRDGDGKAMPFVVCRNVRKSYGTREILKGLDIAINRGEVVTIMGPSGSGKSTLLRLINHLEELDGGEILVNEKYVGYVNVDGVLKAQRDLAKARADSRIGMVFQQFNLFEHLTALENVIEAPVHVYHEDPVKARRLGKNLLASIGLAHHADHLPHRLSGGQQQRVAIARALAISPRLMLFDEPTSALDPELVGDVLAVIRRLAMAGMTMIVVTHEVRFAREVADRIVFIDQGEIVEQGSPEDVLGNPRQERTQRFLRLVEQQGDTAG